jgi:hypothetical protein
MVVLSAERAKALGVAPMARLLGVAAAGVDARIMGIGVVPADGAAEGAPRAGDAVHQRRHGPGGRL